MPLSKKMIMFFIGTFLILIAIAGGVWWYVLFGQPNPPLPQTTVTIQNNSSSTVAATSTASPSAPAVPSSTPSSVTPVSSSPSSTSDADMNPTLPEEPLSIDNATFTVEMATTMLQQARGLSNRPSLGANDGMLFTFSSAGVQSFWMKDMNFPLDMIWISGNTVVGFAQDAPAEPGVLVPSQVFYSPASTDKVLEVNAGTVAKYNIKIGDSVVIGGAE